MHRGYIKIWRKMLDWEWGDDYAMLGFFVLMIMKANWEEKKWRGFTIKRGQFISSIEGLRFGKEKKRLSVKRTRNYLERLKTTGELASESTNRFTLYSIVNYEKYQDREDDKTAIKRASEGQTKGKQRATTKELQEVKEVKNTTKTLPAVSAEKPIHVQFCDRFKESYEKMTGHPYKHAQVDFILVQNLIKQHGFENVVLKAKTLGAMCRDRSSWFTKDGWASFSIGKLSSKWNEIIPESIPNKDRDLFEALKKGELENEKVNRHLNGSGKDTSREGTGETVHT